MKAIMLCSGVPALFAVIGVAGVAGLAMAFVMSKVYAWIDRKLGVDE